MNDTDEKQTLNHFSLRVNSEKDPHRGDLTHLTAFHHPLTYMEKFMQVKD